MDGRDDERNPAVIRPLLPHSSRRALLRPLILSNQRGDHVVIRVDLHAAGSIAACTPLPRCHPAVPTLASVVESLTSDTSAPLESAPLELRSNGLPVEILAAGAPIAFHFPPPHLTRVIDSDEAASAIRRDADEGRHRVSSSPGDERSVAISARGTVYVAASIPSGGAHVTARAASPILRYFSLGRCAFDELLVRFSRLDAVLLAPPLLRRGTMRIRRRGATSTSQPTANRLGGCLVVITVILGVPSMTGAAVTDVREFLDRATSVCRTRPVTLVTLRSDRGQAAYYRTGKIYVSPWVYDSPFRFEIAAHEFGHHLQGPRVASARRAAFRPRSRTVSTRN
jgi:hypothetical protein